MQLKHRLTPCPARRASKKSPRSIVLQLLSYVAQTEREFIRQRQAEGIAAAKRNGVQFGRRPMERPASFRTLKARWINNEISARAAAKRLGVTHGTFLRWAKECDG